MRPTEFQNWGTVCIWGRGSSNTSRHSPLPLSWESKSWQRTRVMMFYSGLLPVTQQLVYLWVFSVTHCRPGTVLGFWGKLWSSCLHSNHKLKHIICRKLDLKIIHMLFNLGSPTPIFCLIFEVRTKIKTKTKVRFNLEIPVSPGLCFLSHFKYCF